MGFAERVAQMQMDKATRIARARRALADRREPPAPRPARPPDRRERWRPTRGAFSCCYCTRRFSTREVMLGHDSVCDARRTLYQRVQKMMKKQQRSVPA